MRSCQLRPSDSKSDAPRERRRDQLLRKKAGRRRSKQERNLRFTQRQLSPREGDRNESNIYDFSPLIEHLKPEVIKEAAAQQEHREKKLSRMRPAAKRKLRVVSE